MPKTNTTLNPVIKNAIDEYFKKNRITNEIAAQLLNVSAQAVHQKRNHVFSQNSARKWHKAFGFDENFLLTGEGQLIDEKSEEDTVCENLRQLAEKGIFVTASLTVTPDGETAYRIKVLKTIIDRTFTTTKPNMQC